MKNFLSLVFLLLLNYTVSAQQQINASVAFQSDQSKDYSLVIPSSYQEGQPIAAFLALHPWNTSRWNGQTWCEELAEFAEENDVILVCPDGGIDGQIDDPIDTAFTTFILDSAFQWYDIDPERLYAIGFSWGGKTTYTYGLSHIEKFAGLLPIGAAVSSNDVNFIKENAEGIPIYIVHGSNDSPNSRFYPLRDAMIESGACVETNLLQGVGHSIDFDNQLQILTDAYLYLQDNACTTTSIDGLSPTKTTILPFNIILRGSSVDLNLAENTSWEIFSPSGINLLAGKGSNLLIDLPSGHYILRSEKRSEIFRVHE